jgi:hypothetical protein
VEGFVFFEKVERTSGGVNVMYFEVQFTLLKSKGIGFKLLLQFGFLLFLINLPTSIVEQDFDFLERHQPASKLEPMGPSSATTVMTGTGAGSGPVFFGVLRTQ